MLRVLLLLAASSAWAAPRPTPRAQAVVSAFHRAVFLTAEARADDPLAKVSAFARGEMRETVIARIPKLVPEIPDLKPEEIRDILDARQGERRKASYGTLTCLFVDTRTWVRVGKKDWVQAPLNETRKEAIWRKAGHAKRREALLALFASAFGKEVRTESASCRGCDGRPHAADLKLGEICASRSVTRQDTTCRSCRGVGVVVSVCYR